MKDLFACTRAELDAFVAAYPRHLERDVYGVCEPPLVTYSDFTLGDWPDSVVAAYSVGLDADPNAPAGSPYSKELPESRWRIAKAERGDQ